MMYGADWIVHTRAHTHRRRSTVRELLERCCCWWKGEKWKSLTYTRTHAAVRGDWLQSYAGAYVRTRDATLTDRQLASEHDWSTFFSHLRLLLLRSAAAAAAAATWLVHTHTRIINDPTRPDRTSCDWRLFCTFAICTKSSSSRNNRMCRRALLQPRRRRRRWNAYFC